LGKGRAYDVTHEEEDAEVIGQAQSLDALMDVLWMKAMIPQAAIPRAKKSTFVYPSRTEDFEDSTYLRKRTPVVRPT
jgi:hypothetical protein